MNPEFISALERAGYFGALPADQVKTLKDAFDQQGWAGIFADSHRFFLADAEDLAEGGLGRFLEEIEPFLTTQGVRLPEIADELSDGGYIVRLGGVEHVIYDAAELKQDCAGEKPGHIWGLSMTRGFKLVNDLLAQAGSAERIYAVNGGNDLCALFLTPEQFRIILAHPDASPKDGPYQPTEDYPWYGAPHDDPEPAVGQTGISGNPVVKTAASPWPLWKQLVAAFLFGCVLLGLKLLLFKE